MPMGGYTMKLATTPITKLIYTITLGTLLAVWGMPCICTAKKPKAFKKAIPSKNTYAHLQLHNPDSRCYFNSTLQLLLQLHPLNDALLQHDQNFPESIKDPVLRSYLEILHNRTKDHIDIMHDVMITSGWFKAYQQEDASEFLSYYLTPLLETTQQTFSASFAYIIPYGLMDVQKAVKNLYVYEKNYETPQILFINMARFANPDKKDETATPYPLQGLQFNNSMYDVHGIVYHLSCTSKSLRGGHFFSYGKIANQWYRFNDSTIEPISAHAMAHIAHDGNITIGGSLATPHIYIYIKRPTQLKSILKKK
jgi:ubiquitin C-terminal hydrolase